MYTKVITPKKSEASNILDDGKVARKFRWIAEIEIDEIWVQDGLDLSGDGLQDALLSHYGWARSDEIKAKIIKSPDPKLIRQAQGYES